MKKEILFNFHSGVSVCMETDIFRMSFGKRSFQEDKVDVEKVFGKLETRKIIALNSSLHSSEIKIVEAKDLQEGLTVLPGGIDGIIIKNIRKRNEDIKLLACFADCGGVCFSSKSGDMIGLIHAGHKGVAFGIIDKLTDFFDANIPNKEEVSIFISPMLGECFEFEKTLFEKNFSSLLEQYDFSPESYFLSIDGEKGFLNLRLLITDIFIKRGIKKEHIVFDPRETNNPVNGLPSHRLFTQYHHIQKNLALGGKISDAEEKFSHSENFSFYKDERRILVGVEVS